MISICWRKVLRGSVPSNAASNARSAGSNRTRSLPDWRCKTRSWCRSAKISVSFSRLPIGNRRNAANVFDTARYANRTSTTNHHRVPGRRRTENRLITRRYKATDQTGLDPARTPISARTGRQLAPATRPIQRLNAVAKALNQA